MKRRIAICGGGIAGLAAAFELTRTAEGRRLHDVTVYQSGWLLGGKGASVRNLERSARIEEHGLHLWMGCYHNAFQLVREVYAELGRPADAPIATCEQAFVPQDLVVLEERLGDGWRHWRFETPRNRGIPGAAERHAPRLDYAKMAVQWLSQVLAHHCLDDPAVYLSRQEHLRAALRDLGLVRAAVRAAATTLAMSLRRMVQELRPTPAVPAPADLDARWTWFAVDFVATHAIGLLRDGLVGDDADFAAIDDEDYRAWLLRHGASPDTVEAPPVRALYTLAFAHDDGISAAVGIPAMLRMMLGYEGSILYRMTAGMGEAIFAPLYEVLARRGVRFAFFHQLLDVGVEAREVGTLRFGVQATPRDTDYRPLIDVAGLPCWPAAPLWDQLVEGDTLASETPGWAYPDGPRVQEIELRVGADFDDVVLAIPASALTPITSQLALHEPRWSAMLGGLKSIATQAVQLWLDADARTLGWRMPPAIVGTYARPFDTWCDMSHLASVERWPAERAPRHIAYFCGQYGLSCDAAPAAPEAAALHEEATTVAARAWLGSELSYLLPGACHDGELRAERIVDIYVRCNVAPSERYQLSAPGTGKLRMAAHDTGFSNLTIAGDWIHTGLDVGCMEAATMAGRQAARAIDRRPRDIPGEPRSFAEHFRRDARRPRFVERTYDLAAAPPFAAEGCEMHAFFLRADRERLRSLIDHTLNEPAGGAVRYVPAAPLVVLGAAFIDTMRPAAPIGSIGEIDVAFWVPLLRDVRGAPPSLVWFMPWVFVDHPAATAAGRETYGFAKLTCAVDHRRDRDGLGSLAVRGQTLARLEASCRAETTTLLEIRRRTVARLESAAPASSLASTGASLAFRGLASLLPVAARGAAMPIVFLRQLRDVARPELAVYQSIIEAPARLTRYHETTWTRGAHDLTLFDSASLPMVKELGLDSSHPEPLACASSRFDFVMDRGREVWRA